MGQEDEMINFGAQAFKHQDHATPKLDFEVCCEHHSQPLRSNRFVDPYPAEKSCTNVDVMN